MNTIFTQNNKPFKALTNAKTSGLGYSLSTIFSILSSFVFIVVMLAFGLNKEGFETSDWYLYISYLLPQISFALLAFLLIKSGNMTVGEMTTKPKARYFILAIVLQIGLLSLSELNAWFLELLKVVGYESDAINVPSLDGMGYFGVLFVIAVMPAFFEELFFRGILLKGLKGFGEVFAVLVCGALFSLYHKNPAQTVYQFACGMAFALVAIRSGSILPTVLSHFLNNAWIITMTKFEWTIDAIYLPFLIVSILCLIASLVYLFFFDKRTEEKQTLGTDKKEKKDFFLFASVGIGICGLTWFLNLLSGI